MTDPSLIIWLAFHLWAQTDVKKHGDNRSKNLFIASCVLAWKRLNKLFSVYTKSIMFSHYSMQKTPFLCQTDNFFRLAKRKATLQLGNSQFMIAEVKNNPWTQNNNRKLRQKMSYG